MHKKFPSLHTTGAADTPISFHADVLELAPDAVIVIDRAGNIAFWNIAAEELFGWRRDEIVGRPFTTLIPEQRREELGERLRQAGRWRRDYAPAIAAVQVVSRSGEWFFIQVHYSRFSRGTERYLVAVVRPRFTALSGDVEESTLFLHTMVESSPDAIICTNASGTVLTWNPAAERMLGFTAEEIVGHSVFMTMPADRQEEARDVLKRVLSGEHIVGYRTVARRKDGTLIDVEPTCFPVYDGSGAILGVAVVTHDLTERVALETKLDDAHRIGAVGSPPPSHTSSITF
jgi:PAS domain S-box-containing protein